MDNAQDYDGRVVPRGKPSAICVCGLVTTLTYVWQCISATVNLAKCVDVRALKRRIRDKLLPRISPEAEVPACIQLISTRSRTLLGNNELLRRCLRDDETELYVIPGSP